MSLLGESGRAGEREITEEQRRRWKARGGRWFKVCLRYGKHYYSNGRHSKFCDDCIKNPWNKNK